MSFYIAGKQILFASVLFVCFHISPGFAIEVVTEQKLPDGVISNINAHLSVFPAPENCVPSNRYRNRVLAAVKTALQSKSYYQAEVQSFQPVSESDCQRWHLSLELGTPLKVREIELKAEQVPGEANGIGDVLTRFPFKSGERFDHKKYEQWKSEVTSIALLKGYFDFRFEQHKVTIDANQVDADIHLQLTSGTRYRFGALQAISNPDDAALIAELNPIVEGEFYDVTKLNQFTQQLKRSGYFESVFVRPLVPQAEDFHVPLEVVYQFKPLHEFNVGGGISSDTGPRMRFSWQRSRLNSAGHSIQAELFASMIEQSLEANYRIPLRDPARNFVSLQLGLKHTDDNDTDSNILSVAAKRHWLEPDSGWQRVAQLRYDQETFRQAEADEVTTALLLPGYTWSRFRSKGELDPWWGDKQILSVEGASKELASDLDLLRVVAQTRWLRTFEQHRLFWRLELGALSTNNFDEVPSSLRFFAGGDQSVRGFGYESLSPVDDEGQLLGGKYLYTSTLEYTYDIFPEWRLALFADAGNAGMSWFDDVATGFGAGVHWVTPVGPLRVYIARGNNELESTWRVHFSLGASL